MFVNYNMYKLLSILLFAFLIAEENQEPNFVQSDSLDFIYATSLLDKLINEFQNQVSNIIDEEKLLIIIDKEIYDIIKEEYLADSRVEDFDIDNISKGYCISSKTRIFYNIKSPMERSVYLSSGNRSGKYCHKCGKESETTIEEPLCEDCN